MGQQQAVGQVFAPLKRPGWHVQRGPVYQAQERGLCVQTGCLYSSDTTVWEGLGGNRHGSCCIRTYAKMSHATTLARLSTSCLTPSLAAASPHQAVCPTHQVSPDAGTSTQ